MSRWSRSSLSPRGRVQNIHSLSFWERAQNLSSLSLWERARVRASRGHSADSQPLTPTLSPEGRGSDTPLPPLPKGRASHTLLRLTDTQPDAIERQLDALALPPRARLSCTLAGDGIRYCVVPWRDDLSAPLQRQRLAEQCFVDAYGEVARGWTVRQHATRWGAAALACAIDSVLLDRLDAAAQARRLRLVSVQPSLMAAYNEARHGIAPGPHWFVETDAHWTTLLLMDGAEALQVKRLRASAADLTALLAREWFALGMLPPLCPVVVMRGGSATDATEASDAVPA